MMMAGRWEQTRELIRLNTNIIRSSGCDTLLLSCPICYRIFKERYKLDGIKVLHHSVYFNQLAAKGLLKVTRDESRRLAYHDPCELGRGCGIYDEPRAVVSAAGTLVEAAKNRQESVCCGGSLGSISLSYEKRKDITLSSLRNMKAGNPDAIITACPLCSSTFKHYSDLPVKDIAELLDEQS